ncbi:MAG: histidine kinase dimerization/phospho-acceptor domain-containing protein [Polyangiaceae bacterium]
MAWGFAGAALALGVLVALFVRARRAERLAELRTDFVAAVSHELRTPLATVRMLSELLEAGAVATEERVEIDPHHRRRVTTPRGHAERMLRFGALAWCSPSRVRVPRWPP